MCVRSRVSSGVSWAFLHDDDDGDLALCGEGLCEEEDDDDGSGDG